MTLPLSSILCETASELIAKDENGLLLGDRLTEIVDRVLLSSYLSTTQGAASADFADIAFLAIGGYGRREIMPYSDIDIMLLSGNNDKGARDAAQTLLYRLWDEGFNISHSFRTLKGCTDDSMKDLHTRTALLDCRFLAGNEALFRDFKRDIYPKLLFKGKKGFTAEIIREIDKRYKEAGDSLCLLEPNVKEGRGGLRDVHAMSWLARSELKLSAVEEYRQFMSEVRFRDFLSAYKFMLKTRACIHIKSARKNDVLSAEIQDEVASLYGFRDTTRFFATEIMMRVYYYKAKVIVDALAKVMNLCGKRYFYLPAPFLVRKINGDFSISRNEIILKTPDVLEDAAKIIGAFQVYSITGKEFSYQVEELLKNRSVFIKKEVRSSSLAIQSFREILRGERVYETLRKMHDTGVLGRFIPEFGRLQHLVILEAFHRYTVDEHTLLAVRNFERLKNNKQGKLQYLAEIVRKVKQEVLFLAILLHDIGKGVSRKHEEVGYIIIKSILERLLIDQHDRQKIEFLVRNHIFLARLALTRDADSPETVIQLAEAAEDEENLDALYLMTYADMSAVNDEFWNEWKASLLTGLYTKTRDHIRGVRKDTYPLLDKKLQLFVREMSERYLLSNAIDEIKADQAQTKIAKKEGLAVSIKETSDSAAEITVITFKMPRLFSRIVGVLSARGLNIIRARLFTSDKGMVIRKIIVSNWGTLLWDGMETGIIHDLQRVILRDETVTINQTAAIEKRTRSKRFETFFEIDNESSDRYTILEVMLPDKIGLLYDITIRLYNYKIDILSAVINTDDGTAHDVFYLNKDGDKLGFEDCLQVLNELWAVEDGTG